MYVTGDDAYQNFLVFAPILKSLIMHNNKKVTNWISTRKSSETVKPFNTNLEPTMSNLANGRVILKFSNSVFVQQSSSLFYSNLILNFYIVFELNNWLLNPTNNFALKNCLFGTAKLVSNTIKSKFTYIVEEYHLMEKVYGVW